jgi:subtilisin family serine protease
MKKFASFVLSASLLAIGLVRVEGAAAQKAGGSNPLYVENQMLIKFKDEAEPPVVEGFVDDAMLPIGKGRIRSLSHAPTIRRGGPYLVELEEGTSVEEAVRRAKADPRVEYAEPNYLYSASQAMPNDTYFNRMWGLYNSGSGGAGVEGADIGALRAWPITTGSDDVVVAVIDSGIDLSHQDLARNAWVNPNEIASNRLDDDNNGLVDDINGWNFAGDNNQVFTDPQFDFHGTHVAGSIGAVGNNGRGIAGVAWDVKLMSLKFLDKKEGKGSTSDAVLGIYYAIDQKARGQNVRVINASWGGPGASFALLEAIEAAGRAGILFVCAAGNDGTDIDSAPDYPAVWSRNIPTLISVASFDHLDNLSSFSNIGHSTVTVAAPGDRIISTVPGNAYGFASGTSMAAPHVSGIAVLLFASEPSLTPAEAKRRIADTSEPVPALASTVKSAGRANAYNALTNTIPPPRAPEIARITLKGRQLTIDGLGFMSSSSVIEIGGVAARGVRYDDSYRIANGSITRLGLTFETKKDMKRAFPKGVPVSIAVYNSTTGQRSPLRQLIR